MASSIHYITRADILQAPDISLTIKDRIYRAKKPFSLLALNKASQRYFFTQSINKSRLIQNTLRKPQNGSGGLIKQVDIVYIITND